MPEKLKVVITDYIEPKMDWESEQFAQRGIEFTYHQLKHRPESEVIEVTRDADIIVVNMVVITPTIMDGWEQCRLVIRHGAGYDNIDVDALTERGILLEYVPDYCSHEVAEHAVALLFALGRKVMSSQRVLTDSIASGQWDFDPVRPMFRLDGATVGIVGCGRIGSLVYHKLEHFGMKFLICDPYLPSERKAELGIDVVDMKTLMRESDFVTVHTPLNDETRHLINAETLALMKPTAYLINTSRGGMVDHEALAKALKADRIAGAAVDVFEKEPPDADFPLIGLDNALITPHLSWYSEDAGWSIREKIVEAIDMFIAGTGPRIAVNAEALAKG
ncbi:MAG: hydroxyacid dehydrogenase [Planctomycetaceae bacterium]|nr:hydroxyacid dehydrogenase [Planctomycetaceae bacterium]